MYVEFNPLRLSRYKNLIRIYVEQLDMRCVTDIDRA